MSREEALERTKAVVRECVPDLAKAPLDEDSVVNTDMGVDSMGLIYIVAKMEDAFDMRVPEERWEQMTTLGDLVDVAMEYAGNASDVQGA